MASTVLVLGSGPIRIGQGIEFDYSCVHCVWALQNLGMRAVIINNNPETVSTDFDTGDALYFEPVTLPDVLRVAQNEHADGVMVQFGGQTAINLAQPLFDAGVKIFGTSPESIARAEDREQFDALLESLGLARPRGRAVRSVEQALDVAAEVGYPVLIRPSFVLGGRAMEIVYDESQLRSFYRAAEEANKEQPVLVDKYMMGVEAEVDVISDGETTLVPGIMEHIERAGVHSGDSMAVYPPVSLSTEIQSQLVESACRLARALQVKGLMNIQYVIVDGKAYILEVNPRASRTVPYLSKVTGIPMVDLATRCAMGEKLKDLGYDAGLWTLDGKPAEPSKSFEPAYAGHIIPEADFVKRTAKIPAPQVYAVKGPVFSFQKLSRVEPSLGPEMKSTGEVLGIDRTYEAALYKAMIAAGIHLEKDGVVLITVRDEDKPIALEIARELHGKGRKILGTRGTAAFLNEAMVPCEAVAKISQGSPNLLDWVMEGKVAMMINSPSADKVAEEEAARIRRACIESGIPCVTSIDTARALAHAIEVFSDPSRSSCLTVQEYFAGAPVSS
ncbi:MAG: carbamoyl-phosphate synthase large subunit [Armatimonadetes bacterium]|nr:carbamoyl-phosphate synthase large subunit [Armatimonadota bacterium]